MEVTTSSTSFSRLSATGEEKKTFIERVEICSYFVVESVVNRYFTTNCIDYIYIIVHFHFAPFHKDPLFLSSL